MPDWIITRKTKWYPSLIRKIGQVSKRHLNINNTLSGINEREEDRKINCILSGHQWLGFWMLQCFWFCLARCLISLNHFQHWHQFFLDRSGGGTKSFMYYWHNLIKRSYSVAAQWHRLPLKSSLCVLVPTLASMMLQSLLQGRKRCDLSGHPLLTWQSYPIIFPFNATDELAWNCK